MVANMVLLIRWARIYSVLFRTPPISDSFCALEWNTVAY